MANIFGCGYQCFVSVGLCFYAFSKRGKFGVFSAFSSRLLTNLPKSETRRFTTSNEVHISPLCYTAPSGASTAFCAKWS